YSWETLYTMGANYDEMWQEYLSELEAAGKERKAGS
ncbi:1-(5-phosphoribosyl)-5-((5-phosphoribosylamino)methylideneamino)imidazole-4-carboxamide isomerase, partial [Solemya velum gill symbiont]